MKKTSDSSPHWQNDLLTTKFETPLLSARYVERRRLVERCLRHLQRPWTLVVAPTGYGKTSLLSELLPAFTQLDRRTAWVSLDGFDNLPIRFWMYLSASLHQAIPHFSFTPDQFLQSAYDLEDMTRLNPFFNAIRQSPHSISLILDDYQTITNPAIHNSLSYFIEHLPRNLHLVLASRVSPPLPTARLRALGQVNEITAEDLSFTFPEAQLFLTSRMELDLPEDEVNCLLAATQGWPAGLQLAALSLKKYDPSSHSAQARSAAERFDRRQIFNYLTEEVFSHLTGAQQSFLLQTSILNELSAPLCDALLQRKDSQQVLEWLAQNNLFITVLDAARTRFRYHPLFAEALVANLNRSDPSAVSRLHHQASAWLLAHGYTEQAIEHAIAANDHAQAAEVIETYTMRAMTNLALNSLVRWIGCFSEDLIARHPELGLTYAFANFHLGRLDQVEPKLLIVEQALHNETVFQFNPADRQRLFWKVQVVRAITLCLRGDDTHGIPQLQNLIHRAPEQEDLFYGSALYWLSIAQNAVNNLEGAIEYCLKSSQYALAHELYPAYIHAFGDVARIRKKQGRLRDAEQEFQNAIQIADQIDIAPGAAALAQTGLLEIAIERGELPEAPPVWIKDIEHYLSTVEAASLLYLYPVTLSARLAKYFLARGSLDTAHFYQMKAMKILHDYNDPIPSDITDLIDVQVRFFQRTGDAETLQADLRQEFALLPPHSEAALAEQMAQARLMLAEGEAPQALETLRDLAGQFLRIGLHERLIENLLLQAQAHRQRNHAGDEAAALRCLALALDKASAERYVRVFIDEGQPISDLLTLYRRRTPHAAQDTFLETLFTAIQRCAAKNGADERLDSLAGKGDGEALSFSRRENEILTLLHSGLTVKEIAARLNISENTASSHIKKVYRKLQVHNRRQMLQRIHELELFLQTA